MKLLINIVIGLMLSASVHANQTSVTSAAVSPDAPIFGIYQLTSIVEGGCFGLERSPDHNLIIHYWNHDKKITVAKTEDGNKMFSALVYSLREGTIVDGPSPRGFTFTMNTIFNEAGTQLNVNMIVQERDSSEGFIYDANFKLEGNDVLRATFNTTRGDTQTPGTCLLKRL